jgi:hypothetical protein
MPSTRKDEEERISEAKRIVDLAREKGVTIRLIGGLAVRNHCAAVSFCEREYLDLDFVGLGKQSAQIRGFFESLGYQENKNILMETGGNQMQFYMKERAYHVDVFIDGLRMTHDLTLKNRLAIEAYTISVSDLLLSKLIIQPMTEKDTRDILTLTKDLVLGETDLPGIINVNYIARLCSEDWGLYIDVLAGIDRCLTLLPKYNLTADEIERIKGRLSKIRETLVIQPKTLRWVLRQIVGRRLSWRRTVEGQGAT